MHRRVVVWGYYVGLQLWGCSCGAVAVGLQCVYVMTVCGGAVHVTSHVVTLRLHCA